MQRRRNIAGGLVLILLGAFFIFWQLAPDSITGWFYEYFAWPYYIIGVGLIFISLVFSTIRITSALRSDFFSFGHVSPMSLMSLSVAE